MSARRLLQWLPVMAMLASAGVAVGGEGVVAIQTAEPSCRTADTTIYEPCDNGTATDNRSGLVWLANANCFGQLSLPDAIDAVAGLADLPAGACGPGVDEDGCDCGLSDGSSAGEWRLPTIAEWHAMIEGAAAAGCSPTLRNDFDSACWIDGCYELDLCSFYDVQAARYWSSSPDLLTASNFGAWWVDLNDGSDGQDQSHTLFYVWPVRGGQ